MVDKCVYIYTLKSNRLADNQINRLKNRENYQTIFETQIDIHQDRLQYIVTVNVFIFATLFQRLVALKAQFTLYLLCVALATNAVQHPARWSKTTHLVLESSLTRWLLQWRDE